MELDEGPAVHAYRLQGDTYALVASVAPGELLEIDEPFRMTFDPAALRP